MHTQTPTNKHCSLIDPTSIQAAWAHGTLSLRIRGFVKEYPTGVTVQELPEPIFPPEFAAVDCIPAGTIGPVGHFPYDIHRLFPLQSYVETVMVRTLTGTKPVKVERLSQETPEDAAAGAPEVLRRHLHENQAMGFSYFDVNVDKAISDAVNKLQKRFPVGLDAKVSELGVTSGGPPIGYFIQYAIVEQKMSAQAQPVTTGASLAGESGPIRSAQPGGLMMTAGASSNPQGVFLEPQRMGARQSWEVLAVPGGSVLRSQPLEKSLPPLYLTVMLTPGGLSGLGLSPQLGGGIWLPEQIFELLPSPNSSQVTIQSRVPGGLVTAASDQPGAPVFLRPAEPGKIPPAQLWNIDTEAR